MKRVDQLIEVCRASVRGEGLVMVKDASGGGVLVRKWNGEGATTERDEAEGRKSDDRSGFMILDSFTASHFVQIHDALSPENQAKLSSFSIAKQVDVMWKLVNRCAK